MDRIAFTAMLLLALGLWVHPYVTGSDPTAHPVASAHHSLQYPAVDVNLGLPRIPAQVAARPPVSMSITKGQKGFWRVGQDATGVWWFLSPKDETQFLNTVTTVQPFQLGRDKEGIHFISSDWTGKGEKDGDLNAWAQKTAGRVLAMGFKGIGAWSNPIFHKFDIPCTRDLNIWAWAPHATRRLYSPEFATIAENAVQTQVTPLKDNTNLVGYFLDNELEWGDGGVGPSVYFDGLATDDPNRREVLKVMQTVWPSLAEFNRDWRSDLKDWKDLDNWASLPHERSQAYARLFTAWLSHLSEDYFKLTCGLVRKYDPNHLILGVRFRGQAPREVVRASRDYTDAQSINYYVSDARLDNEMFKMMNDESGQPIMITEYSFHSLDGRSGNRNTVGFAAQVLDQKARADGYRLFTTRAARVPYIVGVDWFQWSDEPPSGRSSDGEDVNFGMVDIDDNPYEQLANAVRVTSPLLNPAHAEAYNDPQTDVWRESFDTKPVALVPHLSKQISLNGELSDWPLDAKVRGVRHSQTVGLERSSLPLPSVYLGWRDEGLYLGFEVFDNDINGAPAKGWWWTRDFVEFWVSTRPAASDQNGFDVHSHQFFFVPNAWPGEDGLLGTIGQWHRPGDAQNDNLIPHPDIRSATRVLPDRYVVEMFIPASALNGFDPRHEPQMAFNIHVRNFQHAIDYFWSAPKEVMTQIRPNTWGVMDLQPADTTNLARGEILPPTTRAAH